MPNFDDKNLPVATTAVSTSPIAAANDLDVDWGDRDSMTANDGLEPIQPAAKISKALVTKPTDGSRLRGTIRKAYAHGVPLDRISPTVLSTKQSDVDSNAEPVNRKNPTRELDVDQPEKDKGNESRAAAGSDLPLTENRDPGADEPAELSASEALLAKEIGELWFSDRLRTRAIRSTRQELSKIRIGLSERLYSYKSLLVGSGRGGKWASFLREKEIPRATADRYAKRWELSLAPPENRLSEASPEPTTEAITEMVAKMKPKLVRVLTTSESVAQFLAVLAKALQEPESA
jgi:hypothetical protein